MKLKHLAILAALAVASQSWALTAYELMHGCNPNAEGCASLEMPGFGGSGEMSTYTEAFVMDGALWERYEDSKGYFTIITNLTTGKKEVYQADNEGSAMRIISAPGKDQMNRVHVHLDPNGKVSMPSFAQAKSQAAEAEKAKKAQAAAAALAAAEAEKAKKSQEANIAAKKATEATMAAEAIRKAGGIGNYSTSHSAPVSAQPVGIAKPTVVSSTPAASAATPTTPAQPAAGAINARKKP